MHNCFEGRVSRSKALSGARDALPACASTSALPAGDVLIVRHVHATDMQPDSISKWSREFLLERIARHGAFYAASVRKAADAEVIVGIPAMDGGYLLVEGAVDG